MSRILAIADIHIYDYPQRNFEPLCRLHQSRKVAYNIIEVAKQEGADIIVIAGDVIEKSVLRPYVQAEVKLFLDTLMSYFRIGYIIWGNHDMDNKSSNQDFTDSCLAVMLPPNLYYAHQKETTIDNSRIAFCNWMPKFDLSWINGCVDVLFTHVTISYSKSDQYKSQPLDDKKFSLCLAGDVHKAAQTGKFVSIGVPQREKMGDSDQATGVIYDCVTKQWKWVNLNPFNNLMQFQYVSDRALEGWNERTGIWSVYKPANLGIVNGVRDVKVPAWKEIENLVDDIIISNNLQGVHSEVLKNIKNLESKEVDFNFVLTRLYCKNWRSIDEAELYFEDGDKILITGKNGSGKSSLLSALRYAFEENRFLKDFIQIGTKECLTEVDFIYQGNSYKIRRGSKKYGLLVNGEEQKYNNKREFEEDVRARFPFIDYADVYFFDSDHHKLIGGITPERKSEIVSKFFKMDKIDSYNEEACLILDQMTKDSYKWREEIDKSQKLLDYINQKLSLLNIPTVSKPELEQHKAEGLEIQRKNKIWNDYRIFVANLTARIQNYEEELTKLNQEKTKFRSPQQIDSEIDNNRVRVNQINTVEIPKLKDITIQYSILNQQLNQVNDEGTKLYNEWLNLSKTKICPMCGQEIKSTEALENHKRELEIRINDLSERRNSLITDIKQMQRDKQKVDQELNKLSSELNFLNNSVAELMSEKRSIENTERRIADINNSLNTTQSKLNQMGEPEHIELPEHFMETMSRIESDLTTWNEFEKLIADKENAENSIGYAQNELNKIRSAVEDLNKYIKLTGPTGKIYEEIMTRLAEQFSDNQVKYEVITYNFRKKDHLDLSLSFNNNGNWVGYQACSSGQQTVLDINFLSKIVTRMGILVMDEFLKHLDPMNHDICLETLASMNIGCILISSHMESITSFNNKSCKLELNDSGVTKITLE